MFLPKNRLIATGLSLLQTLFSFGELTRNIRRYPWYTTRDIRRYPWYITRDITAAISRVIYHGYLRISSCLCHGYKLRLPVAITDTLKDTSLDAPNFPTTKGTKPHHAVALFLPAYAPSSQTYTYLVSHAEGRTQRWKGLHRLASFGGCEVSFIA